MSHWPGKYEQHYNLENRGQQSKYRLKKKLELDKDGSLNEYIAEL